MSVQDDLDNLAALSQAGAHQALGAQIGLGPRPTDPAPAALWDHRNDGLKQQVQSLGKMATDLATQAVLTGIQQSQDAVNQLKAVGQDAQNKIKQINDVSKLLSALADVLDVGLAVLAVAGGPTASNIAALGQKIQTLITTLAGGTPTPGAAQQPNGVPAGTASAPASGS